MKKQLMLVSVLCLVMLWMGCGCTPSFVAPPAAPGGTPNQIVSRLNAEIVRGLHLPAVIERLAGAGLDATPSSPEQLEAHIRREIDKYRRIIALTGAKPEGR